MKALQLQSLHKQRISFTATDSLINRSEAARVSTKCWLSPRFGDPPARSLRHVAAAAWRESSPRQRASARTPRSRTRRPGATTCSCRAPPTSRSASSVSWCASRLALPALGYPSETKSRCGARRLCSHDRCVWDTSLGPDAVVPRCWERVRVKGATSTWQLIDSTVARAELPCSHGYPYWVRSVVELRVCGSVG